jgi:hypothetical protein
MGFVDRTANTVSRTLGTDSGDAGTAKAVSGATDSVSQALSDFDKTVGISAVSRTATQFANDIGLTNAVKSVSDVVYNIGKAAEKDPMQYAAIIACIAAAPFTGGTSLSYIPYITAAAKVTSQDTPVEKWIEEGAKAYLISTISANAGQYVAGGPAQVDMTTGELVPGSGVAGVTNSQAVGQAAGNISNRIVANAAKGGPQKVEDIIASGVGDAGILALAQQYSPDWGSLSVAQQKAAINGVKTVLGDKTAASNLVWDQLDSTIQAASKAAFAVGYDSPWQKQAAEDGGFTDAKTYKQADKLGITNIGEYNEAVNGGFSSGDELREAKSYGISNKTDLNDLKAGGFDDLFQLNEARAGGFTKKDEYADAKYLGIASLDQYSKYKDGQWTDPEEFKQGMAKGFTDKPTFDDATTRGFDTQAAYSKGTELGFKTGQDYKLATDNNIDAKTWNENNDKSKAAGWDHYADQVNAEKIGFTDPGEYKYAKAVDLENEGADITENYFASQITEVGEDLYALPENAGIYNAKTGEVTDFNGNVIKNMFEGIIKGIGSIDKNQFVNRPTNPTYATNPTSTAPASPTDALSQAAQVIPDYLQDPSLIAKRKDRGTPYTANPAFAVVNTPAPTPPGTQPVGIATDPNTQKAQPVAVPNPNVVQPGLFSGILSPYNPQNQQGNIYG